jgi:ABC-2 type transport system permease protein
MSETTPAGAIHDIGYQRYTGVRLGRPYAIRSLYSHGVRTAFGMGRSAKAKIFPWFSVSVLLLLAIIVVVVRSQTGRMLFGYVDLTERGSLLVLLFLASAAPELVSRDLRAKVLPLYFSRPISRSDYALAKLGALATATWAILAVPMLVMFLGGAFSLHGAGNIWREFTDFLGGLLAAAIVAVVLSVIALLISSLVSRRMIAAAAVVGVFLVTATVSFAVGQIIGGDDARYSNLLGPQPLVDAVNQWLFLGDPKHYDGFGFVLVIAALLYAGVLGLLLLVRYRKVAA